MKEKTLTLSVVVYEWDDETRNDLPIGETIELDYTQAQLDNCADLDELAGELLADKYDATPYDYIVL